MTVPTDPTSNQDLQRISPNQSLDPEHMAREQPEPGFESHMKKGPPTSGADRTQAPTPMELTKPPTGQMTAPSFDSLMNQAKGARDSLGTVEKQLKDSNLKLKRSQTHLLKNKLTDAHEHANAAAAKLELPPTTAKSTGKGGHVEKFFSYVNAGQEQFIAIQAKLKELSESGQPINPADMLFLQSKMGVAQQEIDYSSSLLSKIIESIKQLISVQL